eukprot:scaffold22957_cov26-Prasinocladus_malaysianus.AAC.1
MHLPSVNKVHHHQECAPLEGPCYLAGSNSGQRIFENDCANRNSKTRTIARRRRIATRSDINTLTFDCGISIKRTKE